VFWLGRWCNKVVVVVMVYRGATGVRLSCKCNLGCLLSARPVLVSAHLTRPASPSLKMFQLLGRRNPSSFIWGSHCTYSISANLLYFAIAALFVSSAALLQLQTRGLDRGRQFVAATPKGMYVVTLSSPVPQNTALHNLQAPKTTPPPLSTRIAYSKMRNS
jgi:hypothetical protein